MQRFSTFPATASVGVSHTVTYDTAGATLPVQVMVKYRPNDTGFSVQVGDPNITVVPPEGCTSVYFYDQSEQSEDFELPVT